MPTAKYSPSKKFIHKVIRDDIDEGLHGEEADISLKKRSRFWMLTIYKENVDSDEEFTVRGCIENIRNTFKEVDYIVGQLEIGHYSGEPHIHIAITFNISTCYPVEKFYSLFPNVYICSNKNSIYNSYCMKAETRVEGSTIIYSQYGDEKNFINQKEVETLKIKIAEMESDIADLRNMCQKGAVVIEKMMKMSQVLINPIVDN